MVDGSNSKSRRTRVRAPDVVERLVEAWVAWDRVAAHTPKYPTGHWLVREAAALEDAIAALGLNGSHVREVVAAHRRRTVAGHPEGLSLPDAIQAAVNELMPVKEAS